MLSLKIRLDDQKIYDELLSHPDYPSLLSISDVLTFFKVPNAAYRVEENELENVPCPFIAHTSTHYGDFVLVHQIEKDMVIVSNEKWNKHRFAIAEFKVLFSGTVISAESVTQTSAPIRISDLLMTIKVPLAVTTLVLIFFSAIIFHSNYFTRFNWPLLTLTLYNTAGLITSVLLLIQSVDTNNPLVQKLCQGGGNTNCNAILSSKAAKVFEGLTWSEVGFFYFAGTWFLLLFGGGSTSIWQMLALLNIISLPYTVYSIYYQARVAKQWCILCCTIQALLWLEFISYASSFHLPLASPNIADLSTVFITMLLPATLWVLIKPLLLQIQQLDPLKKQLQKFKYNSELFNKMLTSQPKYAQPDEDCSIVLGNVEAGNVITMVTNPYCPPCANTHKLLHNLLEQNGNLQARIVFTANNTDDDIKTPVSRHLMTLHGLPDKSVVKQALYDWYEQKQKSYESWANAYPAELNEVEYNKINRQKAWCEMAQISATPTILLDGYKLPDGYQLTDLKYMLQ